jgi:hypothetical protein
VNLAERKFYFFAFLKKKNWYVLSCSAVLSEVEGLNFLAACGAVGAIAQFYVL